MRNPGRIVVALLASAIFVGCGTLRATDSSVEVPSAYRYFETTKSGDGFTPMIRAWQSRQGSLPIVEVSGAAPAVSGPPLTPPATSSFAGRDLRSKYHAFREESRRRLARDIVLWVQEQARHHYIPDRGIDHWATLEETFAKNGDDCDGLELLAHNLLLEHGFPREDVYRAIVRRSSDGLHHMVTLWFEGPSDPWVLDPTGTMTNRLERMSHILDWEPLRIFTEESEFSVTPVPASASIPSDS